MRGAAVALLLVLAAGLAALAQDQERRLLAPLDGCTVIAGAIDVVATDVGDEMLTLDGEPCEWQRQAGKGRLARVSLDPGEHEIGLGDETVRITVVAEAPTDGAPILKAHARDDGDEGCTACHGQPDENAALAEVDTPGACLECHTRADFDVAHFHPLDPIAACEMCHALHGSTEKALLRDRAKELCAQCHD